MGCMYSVEKTAPLLQGLPKKLEKNHRFHKEFMQFGEEWNLKSHVLKQLEEFTCLMYGQNRESSMDGLLAKLLRKIVGEDEKLTSKSKVNLARLPPCHSALKPHFQRVNHRIGSGHLICAVMCNIGRDLVKNIFLNYSRTNLHIKLS